MRNIKQKDHPMVALEYRCVDSKYQSKSAAINAMLTELNQIKNQAQQTAQIVNGQAQQTATPNILNYWNCQWMVK